MRERRVVRPGEEAKVFIAGATGVLGRRLIVQLRARGHRVVGFAGLSVGSGTVNFLTTTTRTSNARIRKDLGWAPRYPTFEQGLRQVVDAWKAEGFPPR